VAVVVPKIQEMARAAALAVAQVKTALAMGFRGLASPVRVTLVVTLFPLGREKLAVAAVAQRQWAEMVAFLELVGQKVVMVVMVQHLPSREVPNNTLAVAAQAVVMAQALLKAWVFLAVVTAHNIALMALGLMRLLAPQTPAAAAAAEHLVIAPEQMAQQAALA
jgi:phosphatidylserine synthase